MKHKYSGFQITPRYFSSQLAARGSQLLIILLLTTVSFSCDKADEFYDKVNAIPELDISDQYSYKASYAMGDSMHLYGRLNPDNNLVIEVGGEAVPVVLSQRKEYRVVGGRMVLMDRVSVIITDNVPGGSDQPVKITSSGYSIFGPPVEVVKGGTYLADTVKLVLYHNLLNRSVFFHFVNGKGTIYLYGGKKMEKLENGAAATVFTGEALSDDQGEFSIATMLAGGVDPQEENIYFSAMTTEASGADTGYDVYRFIRYNIPAGQFTTLNRTRVPKNLNEVRVKHYEPFEGNISSVKLPNVTGVYPDGQGNLWLRFNQYALCRVYADGRVAYLYKRLSRDNSYYIPTVWDTVMNKATRMDIRLIPGQETFEDLAHIRISVSEKLMYSALSPTVTVFDIDAALPLYILVRQEFGDRNPIVTGSFAGLTGNPAGSNRDTNFWGSLPLPGERLLQLNYPATSFAGMPAWTVLNFNKSRADRYAPGPCDMGPFQVTATDLILNYDEEGHLYMTANDGARVVKTVYKN